MSVPEITRDFLLAHPLPEPEIEGDKQSRGRVLVVAGSVDIPGAALLAGLGSLRAGSGILQIATCRSNAAHLGVAIPEAMVIRASDLENEWVGVYSDSVKEDLNERAGAVSQSVLEGADTLKNEIKGAGAETFDRVRQAGVDAAEAGRKVKAP
jgi:NAD(P)H-hydrate repair Nnr-like enzyme with NAD(P)H-hydrate dehydratase domain